MILWFHWVNSAFLPSSYSGIVVTLSWSLAVLTLVRHSLTSRTSLTRLSIRWVLSLDPSFIYWRLKYFSRLSSNVIHLHAFWKSLHSSPDISASLPSGISSGRISLPGFLRMDGAMWPVSANELYMEVIHFIPGPRIQLLIQNPLELSFSLAQQYPDISCSLGLGSGLSMMPRTRNSCPPRGLCSVE